MKTFNLHFPLPQPHRKQNLHPDVNKVLPLHSLITASLCTNPKKSRQTVEKVPKFSLDTKFAVQPHILPFSTWLCNVKNDFAAGWWSVGVKTRGGLRAISLGCGILMSRLPPP